MQFQNKLHLILLQIILKDNNSVISYPRYANHFVLNKRIDIFFKRNVVIMKNICIKNYIFYNFIKNISYLIERENMDAPCSAAVLCICNVLKGHRTKLFPLVYAARSLNLVAFL